eukprot:m.26403 g.26403  ORF g.26403 m.26403 type:complete len:92 (+) comp11741_c0_seq2:115-390(+)
MSKSVFSGKGTFTGMLKQHPEILPVVAAVGVACVGAVFYMGRLCTRPDVVWSGRQDMPWTRVSQKTNLHFTPFSTFKSTDTGCQNDLRGKL